MKGDVVIRFWGDRAELLCSHCRKSLWDGDKITVRHDDGQVCTVVQRLLAAWGECNGDPEDVKCIRCQSEETQ